jgi:hypothetical protein
VRASESQVITYERDERGSVVAVAEIAMGASRRTFRTPLGPWEGAAFDPGGLRGMPVVVLPDATWTELARRGALRAGGQPPVLLLPGDAPRLGIQFLVAYAEGVDVVIVDGAAGSAMTLARVLGGRPIPALPLPDAGAVEAFLAGCEVDLDVPVPALEGVPRADLRASIGPLHLEETHHLVEVDPRPAFDELRIPIADATPGALTAAAAGVLAGRVSIRSRRWRSPSP